MRITERHKMSGEDWELAHKIASELVRKGVDVNELAKVFTYLRARIAQPDAINSFWLLLGRLPKARAFVRSGRTLEYYRDIKEVCEKHIKGIKDMRQLVAILGWSVRLLKYHRSV